MSSPISEGGSREQRSVKGMLKGYTTGDSLTTIPPQQDASRLVFFEPGSVSCRKCTPLPAHRGSGRTQGGKSHHPKDGPRRSRIQHRGGRKRQSQQKPDRSGTVAVSNTVANQHSRGSEYVQPTIKPAYFVYDGASGNNAGLQVVSQVGLRLISKLRCNSTVYFP